MKALTAIFTAAIASATALLLAGCHNQNAVAHEAAADPGVTFNSKKGLLIAPASAKFIGLKTAEVSERQVASSILFSAQVYRAHEETLASGRISVADAARLTAGQKVSVKAGEETFSGRIEGLKQGLEKANGEVEVLVAVPEVSQKLAAGAFISVTAPLAHSKDVMSVPRSSVFYTTEGNFVYTVSGDHFVRAAVKLGAVNPEFAEVTDGLYTGDQVVASPVMTLWMAELQSLRGGKACADGQ